MYTKGLKGNSTNKIIMNTQNCSLTNSNEIPSKSPRLISEKFSRNNELMLYKTFSLNEKYSISGMEKLLYSGVLDEQYKNSMLKYKKEAKRV